MSALSLPRRPPGSPGTADPVRLGRVDYVNVLPVYMGLDEEGTRCRLVPGVPTALNANLRAREIECAPVSAVEVARAGGAYAILPDLSISSVGPVGSSMLISRRRPEDLDGASVALSTHSAASLAYFRVLCARLWRVAPRMVDAEPDLHGMLASHDACVLIGNPAIVAAAQARRHDDLHVVDIGAAWLELTGLPCVFAVWALWSAWAAGHLDAVAVLREDLARGRAWGSDPGHRHALDARGAAETGLSVNAVHDYFDLQDYRLTDEHQRGLLRLFAELAALDLAPPVPRLEFTS